MVKGNSKSVERRKKAKIILDVMAEEVINMNWNEEERYLKAIEKALKKIEEREKKCDVEKLAEIFAIF